MKDDFLGQIQVSPANEKTKYIKSVSEYTYDVGRAKCTQRIIHYMQINEDNTGVNIYIETSGQNPNCGINSGLWSHDESGEKISREVFLEVLNKVKKQLAIA